MSRPKISVIIVYSSEQNLYECVQSALQQSFSNIEVICVNNGAGENAENIVQNQAKTIDRIKLISMPLCVDNNSAKKAGLAIAQGDFVIFIENNDIVEADFIKQAYMELQKEQKNELKNKYLYRRSFIENDREISDMMEDKINEKLPLYSEFIEEQKKKIDEKFDYFYKNNVENVKNNTYEIMARFNALEKLFFDKEAENKESSNSLENSLKTYFDCQINKVFEDMHKIYDYIDSVVKQKDDEISQVYEEITRNYKYTENLIEQKEKNLIEVSKEGREEIYNKLTENEKEIVLRYLNLKRLMDLQFDEIKAGLKSE